MSSRAAGDDGAIAAMVMVVTAGLLMVPVAATVSLIPAWVERQALARTAAAEAARTVAQADSWSAGVQAAHQLVARMATNRDVPTDDLQLEVTGGLLREATITATTTVALPDLTIPLIGRLPGATLTATHSTPVARYRNLPPRP